MSWQSHSWTHTQKKPNSEGPGTRVHSSVIHSSQGLGAASARSLADGEMQNAHALHRHGTEVKRSGRRSSRADSVTPWTTESTGLSGQEHWSGEPFPPPGRRIFTR